MATQAGFWDKISIKYAKKAVPSEEIYQEKLKRTRKLFTQDSEVLEFGCGTGTTALNHAPFVKHIKATDYSKGMIDIANQKKEKQQIKNVEFKVQSVEQTDFRRDYYDVIMGHSILHLTQNNEALLKQVHQSLKPGGYFVTSSGCIKEMNPLIRIIIPLMQLIGKAPKITPFTADELIDLHMKTGFEIVDPWKYKNGELFLIARK